jgi:hypothetical protein
MLKDLHLNVNDNEHKCELTLVRASSPVHAPIHVVHAPLHAQSVWNGTLHSHPVHSVHAHSVFWREDSYVQEISDTESKTSYSIFVSNGASYGCVKAKNGTKSHLRL